MFFNAVLGAKGSLLMKANYLCVESALKFLNRIGAEIEAGGIDRKARDLVILDFDREPFRKQLALTLLTALPDYFGLGARLRNLPRKAH